MKIKKRNLITWLFFFVIVALENFSWLIPSAQYMIPGILKFSDIGVVFAILWGALVIVTCNHKKKKACMVWPVLFIPVLICSAYAANKYFGQTYGMSIRQYRYMLACFWVYYCAHIAVSTEKLKINDIYLIIKVQASIEIALFLAQYLLASKIVFIYAGMDSRYGSVRLRVSYLLALIFMYICMNDLLHNKKMIKNLIGVLGGALILMVVCKHRAPSLIMLATFVIAYVLWKKGFSAKLFIGIILIVIAVSFLANSTMMQDIIDILVKGTGYQNISLRTKGREYYFLQLIRSPWFGFGNPNSNCKNAVLASGQQFNYYIEDNGIFGFLYCHGVLGVFWLVLFFASILKQSVVLFKAQNKYHFLLYFLYEIGNLYMGMHWFYYYTLPFILILILLNKEYYDCLREQTEIGAQYV